MYSKQDLLNAIIDIGVKPNDTLLIHSSYHAIGEVEGGADTVLDVFIEYLQDEGLLILPTHSWSNIDKDNPIFDPVAEPSCVGYLTNLFLERPGVIRSLHPTHSVAAIGKDAAEYTSGEEYSSTPAPRTGCWGKLYDRKAKILFLGCTMKRNTYLHSVEEWNEIPDRISKDIVVYKIKMPDGSFHELPSHRHGCTSSMDVSFNYDRVEPTFRKHDAVRYGKIGRANSILGDAVMMADIVTQLLKKNPDLFTDYNL